MASTGKKHKCKGRTFHLNAFLGSDQEAPSGYAVVNARSRLNWADAMENEEVDDKFTIDFKKEEKIILPTAPKAARGPDIELSRVPIKPPFTAYLGNLPYDILEEDITKFFRKLKVSSVRLPRESGERSRLRGFGYAEFEDRESLIDALALNNEMIKNRAIKVSLAEEHDGERDRRGNDSRPSGFSDRTAGDWRAAPRDESIKDNKPRDGPFGGTPGRSFDDADSFRGRSGFGRDGDRDNDRDYGFGRDRYSKGPRSFTDDRDGFDRERGYERRFNSDRDRGFERRGDYERGYDRQGRGGRRDFGSSYRDDYREEPKDRFRDEEREVEKESNKTVWNSVGADDAEAPKERKRLQLKPRSVPLEQAKEPAPAATASAIFGGARPVDTTAREREIEERLFRQKEEEEKKNREKEGFMPERRDERIRRSSVGSGSGRSRRSSDSRDFYDEPRPSLSRQISNDSDQHYHTVPRSRQRHSSVTSTGSSQDSPSSSKGDGADSKRSNETKFKRLDSGSSRELQDDLDKPPRPSLKAEETKPVVYTTKNIYTHLLADEEEADHGSD